MIVRQFLQWVQTASPGERADATSALARAYLHSELSVDDLAAAEGAMLMLLDDPSPLVRRALAEVFASSQKAPPVVVQGLAADQPEISSLILSRSPLLLDADLVDRVATAQPECQIAIASRPLLARAVSAAIAEVGSAQACLVLLENTDADIAAFSVDRIAARYGHLAPIRETLLLRPDLPAATRQLLLATLSQTLAGFVVGRQWIAKNHADHAAKEACERATVALAAQTHPDELPDLVHHLCESGQLNAGLILRGLLSGHVMLFEQSLAELTGVPVERVASYVHDRNISGFAALYGRAGLPSAAYPAFREAIAALREGALLGEMGGMVRLKRRMVERVLAGCVHEFVGDIEPVLALLRRFASEAAREEARLFCEDLVAAPVAPVYAEHDVQDYAQQYAQDEAQPYVEHYAPDEVQPPAHAAASAYAPTYAEIYAPAHAEQYAPVVVTKYAPEPAAYSAPPLVVTAAQRLAA
jgi:uncharacterized protein (DUF2336 family)